MSEDIVSTLVLKSYRSHMMISGVQKIQDLDVEDGDIPVVALVYVNLLI